MKAIEILETLSTEIKKGENVGQIGIMVQIKDDEMLKEGKKAKSILEAFAERVEFKVAEAGNYHLSQFPDNDYPVFRLTAGPFGKFLEK
ncbi:hypothetical protein K4P45_11685 [Staphylococcus epidermidis]|nr:hypothetical protein [Staphylococcus epidermidis]MCG2212803.1 hypothetical protein [Staphylococcus epidermidis]